MTTSVEYFEFPSDFNRNTIESEYKKEKVDIKYDYLSELRKTFYENVRDAVNQRSNQTHLQFVDTPVESKKEIFQEIIEKFWNRNPDKSNILVQSTGSVINNYTGVRQDAFYENMVAIHYLLDI